MSVYDAAVPAFLQILGSLPGLLSKAEAHCKAKNILSEVLLGARLYPDMFAFARQIQTACDTAKGAMARLGGVDNPKHEDTEQTFAELKERIAKTIAFLETFKPAQIDGTEEKALTIKLGPREVQWKGMQYLLGFALPNFYFHAATAYDILRHNGVELAKRDFIGNV
jgi:hypothetical protein